MGVVGTGTIAAFNVREQDAYKLAAVDDLLEALTAVLDSPEFKGLSTHEIRRARAAIAKATQSPSP